MTSPNSPGLASQRARTAPRRKALGPYHVCHVGLNGPLRVWYTCIDAGAECSLACRSSNPSPRPPQSISVDRLFARPHGQTEIVSCHALSCSVIRCRPPSDPISLRQPTRVSSRRRSRWNSHQAVVFHLLSLLLHNSWIHQQQCLGLDPWH